MEAYRRVYDSHHLQADFQEPVSAPEPYARQSSMGYLYFFSFAVDKVVIKESYYYYYYYKLGWGAGVRGEPLYGAVGQSVSQSVTDDAAHTHGRRRQY